MGGGCDFRWCGVGWWKRWLCGWLGGVKILVALNGMLDFEVVSPGGVCDVLFVSDVFKVVW